MCYWMAPHSGPFKHRAILSAEWIEGAAASYDSGRFIAVVPGAGMFIKGKRREKSHD